MDLTVSSATAHRVPYPLRRPFAAVHQTMSDRDVIVVRLDTDAGPGWSECPVLPAPGYQSEFTDGEFEALVRRILPELFAVGPVSAARWSAGPSGHEHRPARAAVEVALLDAQCRAQGVSLASHLGAIAADVPAGAAIGLGGVEEIVAEAERLRADGYARIKAKIAPGADLEVLLALREAVGSSVDLQADANGAYAALDIDWPRGLEAVGLTSLEQPFAPDDLGSHARLSASTSTPVCLDESIGSPEDIPRVVEAAACRIVSLKWSRLGGPLATARTVDQCRELGMSVTIGGMLSSGLGRAVDLALAALPGVDVTGDQSGSARYADFDLTEEMQVSDGRLRVPSGPGLGVSIDEERITATSVATVTVTARG